MSHHNLLSLLFPVASKVITLESGVRLDTDPGFGEFVIITMKRLLSAIATL